MKLFSNQAFGLLLLRLAIGGIFLYHGILKLQNMQGTIGFFDSLGFPAFMAWMVALIETVGGALMILGIWPMAVGLLFAAIMVVAILKTKLGGSFGAAEKEVIILVSSLTLAFGGAGSCSLIRCMKKCAHRDGCNTESGNASEARQNPPSTPSASAAM